MRVLHVVPTYLPATRYGGPIYSVHHLCRALVRQGCTVDVATTSVDGAGDSAVPLAQRVDLDGVGVHYFRSPLLRRLYYAPTMRAWLRRELPRYDLVHLHSVYLWPTNCAARIAERAGRPYVVAPRGMLVPELIAARNAWIKRAWLHLVEARTLRHACALHCTSEAEVRDAARVGLPMAPAFVLANGVEAGNLDAPCPDWATKLQGRRFVLALGRLNWKKQLDWLVRALPHLGEVELVLAGPDEAGCAAALRAEAERLGVVGRLHLPGPQDGSAKAWLLAHCALLAMPSLSENFGNSALEALAAARPAMVTDRCGVAADVLAAGAGWVTPVQGEAFQQRLVEALTDSDECDRRGARGLAFVGQQRSWDAIAAQLLERYRGWQRAAC